MEGYSRPEALEYAKRVGLHAKIRETFLTHMKSAGCQANSLILLQGASESTLLDTDTDMAFVQDSYFHYLFGVEEGGCVAALSVATGRVDLFVPQPNQDLGIWFPLPTLEGLRGKYGFEAHWKADLLAVLSSLQPELIYVNKGVNSDSGSSLLSYIAPADLPGFTVNEDLLNPILANCRVYKLPEEVAILRQAAKAASKAQVAVMRRCSPGLYEYQLAAEFLYTVGNWQQTLAFCSICSAGPHSAILHNMHPDGRIGEEEIVVSDQGSSLYGYKSDITIAFPANKRFNRMQKEIYEAVLDAQSSVKAAAKPGVEWTDMHKLAESRILTHLQALGLVKGEISAMVDARVGGLFMPHGLGHFLGLDTHDVGGYMHSEERILQLGLRSLRTRRVLEPGMYITVEPGCYFIDFLLDRGLQDPVQSQYLVAEKIAEYRGFGGVRLEDDMLITETGNDILSHVPRTVEDIESVLAGGEWLIN
jgi:Xaa-Pro dipeptidase